MIFDFVMDIVLELLGNLATRKSFFWTLRLAGFGAFACGIWMLARTEPSDVSVPSAAFVLGGVALVFAPTVFSRVTGSVVVTPTFAYFGSSSYPRFRACSEPAP